MKPNNDPLDRLLKAAARAGGAESRAATFTLEARALASWRAARGDDGEVLLTWLRRAAICAGVLAVAGLAWNYHDLNNSGGDELAVADAAMRTGVEP